jgi:hypothetical protein
MQRFLARKKTVGVCEVERKPYSDFTVAREGLEPRGPGVAGTRHSPFVINAKKKFEEGVTEGQEQATQAAGRQERIEAMRTGRGNAWRRALLVKRHFPTFDLVAGDGQFSDGRST